MILTIHNWLRCRCRLEESNLELCSCVVPTPLKDQQNTSTVNEEVRDELMIIIRAVFRVVTVLGDPLVALMVVQWLHGSGSGSEDGCRQEKEGKEKKKSSYWERQWPIPTISGPYLRSIVDQQVAMPARRKKSRHQLQSGISRLGLAAPWQALIGQPTTKFSYRNPRSASQA